MKYNKVPLGDLITVLTDYHANGAYQKLKENVELLDDEDYALMVRTTNFESNDFSDSLKFISEHAYNFLEKSKVYGGDLIMNKIANAGSIYLMPDLKRPVSLAMNLFLIRVDEQKANPVYVYIFLKINEAYVKQFANGSVTKTITKDAVRNLEISLPPREVQNEIANQYNSLSKKIAVNSRINKILEEMAQAIFKSWFVDFDPVKAKMNGEQPEGMDAATASLFPDKLVESELGSIPEGWSASSMGEHFNITMGQSPKGETYNEEGEGIAFFQGRRDFGFRYPDVRVYTTDPKRFAKAGDTLISVRAPVGDKNMAAIDCCIGRGVAAIKHKSDSRSFTYAFMSHIEKKLGDSGSSGTVFSSINQKELKKVSFVAPPQELIEAFHKIVDPIDQKVEVLSKEIESLSSLRDTLLPKLLSGEIELGQAQELAEVE
ncbi:restriction endonuclease subunit S [Vibrio alginolyticus]|uniref:restriction endonuclease subunit S n=1 Tax=Vibrio alginolyticus TaxID=663 RepID=UPI001BD450C9|nr:restriction endonuclease subunit S [Vibrio alginolyticus]MBS9825727.1 restriction endonuclease subunit S [Vibrio alginolyticus]